MKSKDFFKKFKGKKASIALLLFSYSVLIQFLIDETKIMFDEELLGFFNGLLFGAGIVLLIESFYKKNKKLF